MVTVEGIQPTPGPSCTSPAKWGHVPSVDDGPNSVVPMTTLVKLSFSKLDYSLINYGA